MSLEFIEWCPDIIHIIKHDDERDSVKLLDLYKYDGIWLLNEAFDNILDLSSAELRQIADKLDELNNAK